MERNIFGLGRPVALFAEAGFGGMGLYGGILRKRPAVAGLSDISVANARE